MGLKDIKLSLRTEDIKDGDVVEIEGEATETEKTNATGGKYKNYGFPIKHKGQGYKLWLSEKETAKIVRGAGPDLKQYLGARLVLGLDAAIDKKTGQPLVYREGANKGKPVMNFVIRSVERQSKL